MAPDGSIHKLPNEILDLIFSQCSTKDLLTSRAVCKRWQSAIDFRLKLQKCLVLCPKYCQRDLYYQKLSGKRRKCVVYLPLNDDSQMKSFFAQVNSLLPNICDLSLLYFCDNNYTDYIRNLLRILASNLTSLHIDYLSIEQTILVTELSQLRHLYLFNVNGVLFEKNILQNLKTLQFNSMIPLKLLENHQRLLLMELENAVLTSEMIVHYFRNGFQFPNLAVLELRFLSTDDWDAIGTHLQKLISCPKLQKLILFLPTPIHGQIRDDSFRILSQIRYLEIRYTFKVPANSPAHHLPTTVKPYFPNLESFKISFIEFSSAFKANFFKY